MFFDALRSTGNVKVAQIARTEVPPAIPERLVETELRGSFTFQGSFRWSRRVNPEWLRTRQHTPWTAVKRKCG